MAGRWLKDGFQNQERRIVRKRISVFCAAFIGLSLISGPKLDSQGAWREIVLGSGGEPIPTLRGIAIPATAECNGQKMKAFVLLWGHVRPDGMGYPTMGILVENLEEVIPAEELEQFDGPDWPALVLKSKTMNISISNKMTAKTIGTRVFLSGAYIFPEDVRGNESNFFDMNVKSTKSEDDAWKQFVAYMSSGFDKGHLTIGGPIFSHKLNVEFSGKGIEPLLKELMLSVGP